MGWYQFWRRTHHLIKWVNFIVFIVFFWPLKVDKAFVSYFNHQIKHKPSLSCNMRLIHFLTFWHYYILDTALCQQILIWYIFGLETPTTSFFIKWMGSAKFTLKKDKKNSLFFWTLTLLDTGHEFLTKMVKNIVFSQKLAIFVSIM